MTSSKSMLADLAVGDVDVDIAAAYAATALWFRHHWVGILLAAGLAAAIVVALLSLRALAVGLCNRDRPGASRWWRVAGRTAAKTQRAFIVLAALQAVIAIADPPDVVVRGVAGLFTVAAVLQGAFWARELILGAVDVHTGSRDPGGDTLSSAIGIIRVIVSIAVFAIAAIVVLDNLGVNVTGLVAGLGVGGIAIGLAAQGIFGDLFAALAIILDRPFGVGDTISYDQTTGTVEAIGLKSTRLRAPSGEERIIANRQLLDKEIQNISRRSRRRQKFALGIVYQTPADVVARIPAMLREEVERHDQHFVQAGFVNFGASSIDIEVEYDTPSADFAPWYQARHAVGLAIMRRFAAEGIAFAYPTQTSFTAAPDGTFVLPYAAAKDGE